MVCSVVRGVVVQPPGERPGEAAVGGAAEGDVAVLAPELAKVGLRLPAPVVPYGVDRVRVVRRYGYGRVMVDAHQATGGAAYEGQLARLEVGPADGRHRRAADQPVGAPGRAAVRAAVQVEHG